MKEESLTIACRPLPSHTEGRDGETFITVGRSLGTHYSPSAKSPNNEERHRGEG